MIRMEGLLTIGPDKMGGFGWHISAIYYKLANAKKKIKKMYIYFNNIQD